MMTLRAKLAPILPCCLDYRVFAVDDSIPGQDAASVALFRKLGLSRHEIQLFYDAFNAVDANRSGTLDAFEFGDAVGDLQPSDVENFGESELAGKLFGSFDLDHGTQSEGLDFKEFVVSIWNYATYSLFSTCASWMHGPTCSSTGRPKTTSDISPATGATKQKSRCKRPASKWTPMRTGTST